MVKMIILMLANLFPPQTGVFVNLLGVPSYWAFPVTGRSHGQAATAPGHGEVAFGAKPVGRTWTGANRGWSGARAGVSILRGNSKMLIFQDAPRFPKIDLPNSPKIPPSTINYPRSTEVVFEINCDLLGFTYDLRSSTVIQDFLRFHPSCFYRFYLKRSRLKTALDPPKTISNYGYPTVFSKLFIALYFPDVEICKIAFC